MSIDALSFRPSFTAPAPAFSAAAERARDHNTAGKTLKPGEPLPERPELRKSAKEFESMFVGQMISHMFEGMEADETFGGGHGEEMFRGLLVQEYGKQVAQRGGLGIADNVYRVMLEAQEKSQ
ncbi:MAG TPA: rod-binding protein [Azospirillaceae bacterium]|nr:rod-binding protein [Azospirillaceae bacterium]